MNLSRDSVGLNIVTCCTFSIHKPSLLYVNNILFSEFRPGIITFQGQMGQRQKAVL